MLHLLDHGTTLAQFFIHLRSPFPVYKIDMLETTVGGSDSFERCIHCGLIRALKNCVCNVVQVRKNTPGPSEVFSCGGKKKKPIIYRTPSICQALRIYFLIYSSQQLHKEIVLFLFFRYRICVSKSLSDMFKFMWLVRSREGVQCQTFLNYGLCLLPGQNISLPMQDSPSERAVGCSVSLCPWVIVMSRMPWQPEITCSVSMK